MPDEDWKPPIDALWDSWEHIPDYALDDGPYGWGVYETQCNGCGHRWVMVAAVGSHGKECPECGDFNPDHLWHYETKGR
jgi:hypothetical protein